MKNLKISDLIAFTMLIISILLAYEGRAAEFTANYLITDSGQTTKSKIFIKEAMSRQEFLGRNGEIVAIAILRPDKKLMWNILPEQRQYIEMNIGTSPQSSILNPVDLTKIANSEMLGEEMLNGYRCQKYRLKNIEDSNTGVIQWFSKKLEVSVKTEMTNQSTGEIIVIQYTNIQEKTIPDSKFEIPPGFQKFSMPTMPKAPGGQSSEQSGAIPSMPQ